MFYFSRSSARFRWYDHICANLIEITPQSGTILPEKTAQLEVKITGTECGHLNCDLLCKVEHNDAPLLLQVQAYVEGPRVIIGEI